MSMEYSGPVNETAFTETTKKLPIKIFVIGIFAGVLTSISFLPQVIKLFKNKTKSDITWVTLILCIIGQILWISYGGLSNDKILLLFSVITLITFILLMISKILPNFK